MVIIIVVDKSNTDCNRPSIVNKIPFYFFGQCSNELSEGGGDKIDFLSDRPTTDGACSPKCMQFLSVGICHAAIRFSKYRSITFLRQLKGNGANSSSVRPGLSQIEA